MNETRLPSGDPLSTRTEPGEGTGDLEIALFPEETEGIVIRMWDDEIEDDADGPVIVLEDSDLIR